MQTQEFIENFVKGTLGRRTVCGNWSVINWGGMDVLQFKSGRTEVKWDYVHSPPVQIITEAPPERVAYRLPDGSVLSNANQLRYVGVRMAWGSPYRDSDDECDEQIWLRVAGAVPIPFTLFDEIEGADVRDFSWIVKPKPEHFEVLTVPRWKKEPRVPVTRHFPGACLFAIDKEVFLFDVDRKELEENKIFNPFVTKLPRPAKTIKEAYDILMPKAVKKALSKGTPVKRQGEFFFVWESNDCPAKVNLTPEEEKILRYPPSKHGFDIWPGERDHRYVCAQDLYEPYPENTRLDTPAYREYQKAALRYKAVREKVDAIRAVPGSLGKSATGSHEVEKYVKKDKIAYVSGLVKQSRREHGDINLEGWYRVYPNTGVLSWTITGKID
jgi:hypothetical protein